MLIKRIEYVLLVVLDAFLALTAAAGGIGLLTGTLAPGVQLLQGSPFTSYTIPGLALLVLVGGSALVATILLLRRQRWGALASGFTGVMIMGFELVEVLVIGSEAGLARNLQLFYFGLGLIMAIIAAALWMAEHRVSLSNVQHNPAR